MNQPRAPMAAWKRAALRRFGVAVALILVGAAIASVLGGTGQLIGFTIFGIGMVLVVSFAFLEVGYSEDRARARERGAS